MEKTRLISKRRAKKEAAELNLYNEFMRLRADKDNDRMEINKLLMKKYKIYSISTLYQWVHRVEKRLGKEACDDRP